MTRLKLVVVFFLLSGVVFGGIYFWKTKTTRKSDWQTHKNVKIGYEIKTPINWTKESVAGVAEVFWSLDKKAYVAVQFIAEPRLLEENGEKKIVKEIKEGFEKDRDYKLSSFESRFEEGTEVPATASGYLARGSLKYQNKGYVFQEYAVRVADGQILAVIRGAIQDDAVEEYQKIIGEVMRTFDPVAGMREAIAMVKEQREVVDFEKLLARAGKKANYGIEDDDNDWSVQVYEIVEQDGGGHTATFNWYRVDKETRKVRASFSEK